MNTLLSQLKSGIRNIVVVLAALVCILSGSTLFAQQTMSLGNLQFVLPNADATIASRAIRMKMAGGSISSSYYKIIGGIAFTQTAIPDFDISSISLQYSNGKATAYINGESFIIPLEPFILSPTVKFADSGYDVVMTMYGTSYGSSIGEEKESILFHDAFIDNIAGLRLLQVDALYQLGGSNGHFPIFSNDEYCLTDSERREYRLQNERLLAQNSGYSLSAQKAYTDISEIISDEFNSFIYTDIGQPIHFKCDGRQLSITGLPYYQFSRYSDKAEPVDEYYWYKNLMENYDTFFDVLKQSTDLMKAYASWFSPDAVSEIQDVDYKALLAPLKDIFNEVASNPYKTDEQKAAEFARKKDAWKASISNPQAVEFVDSFTQLATIFSPMWESADDITYSLRNKPELVRALNPIVYSEVDQICQWSAFFRYVKEKSPSSWRQFFVQVSSAHIDAPSVQTPVSEKQGYNMFDLLQGLYQ